MSTERKYLKWEESGPFGILTLNRPDKLNALNEEVLEELKSILTELQSSSLKGMIFTGEGEKAFIAGADIASMSEMTVEEGRKFATLGQEVTFLFESLPFPVVAAVNGFALGGGCEMAMSCDLILATENAIFGQPEVKLGLIPGFGGTQRLAKLVGRHRAKELVYTGRNLKAQTALEWGLVLEVHSSKENLMQASQKLLESIAQNSPYAVKISKQVMNKGNDLTVYDGLMVEREEFGNIFSSYDLKEGTKAFVEKRKPEFQGK